MPKPSTLPRWADNLADPGDIVEPLAGKKDIGWQDAEMPPHTYMNWLFNLIYLWTVYLDGLTGEALTWTAEHIFQDQATFNGSLIVPSSATFSGGISVQPGSDVSLDNADLLIDNGGILTVKKTDSSNIFSTNPTTGLTTFEDDVFLDNGASLSVEGPVTAGSTLAVTGATTGAAATFSGLVTAQNGALVTQRVEITAGDQANPINNVNELSQRGLIKAKVSFRLNGTSTPDILKSYNVASVVAGSNNIQITLTEPLADADSCLALAWRQNSSIFAIVQETLAGGTSTAINLQIREGATGTVKDPSADYSSADFVIHLHVS